jgi:hypothetical protein
MNRDDIIRIAREAGFAIAGDLYGEQEIIDTIERFAALVALAEREECIEACKSDGWTVAAYIIRAKGQS